MTETKIPQGNIVVRMAPSPTGFLHVGTARTTLFNYLFAKKYGGKFILRIEDTDKERSTKEYEEDIINGLEWLGLSWDEFYRQSERVDIYKDYVKKMINDGVAYVSKEEPKEEGQREEVIRFKNPNKKIVFEDLIRGTVEFDTTELGDFVIARSMEDPLYHLAVVIDDFLMGVTHVIRGEDHISNTPRQILIQEAIGAARPMYAHIPLIFDEERKKLSKRKHGAVVWIDTYRKEGYLPQAMINFFASMGWNSGTEQEIFTLPELSEAFDIKGVQKGAAIYNIKKLRWINKEHLKRLPQGEVEKMIKDKLMTYFGSAPVPEGLPKVVAERVEVLGDVDRLASEGEFDYFLDEPVLDKDKISWKSSTKEETIKHLKKALDIVSSGGDLMKYAEEVGKGNVLWPVRYSLSGKDKSPDPFTLIELLGKEKSCSRIEIALKILD